MQRCFKKDVLILFIFPPTRWLISIVMLVNNNNDEDNNNNMDA